MDSSSRKQIQEYYHKDGAKLYKKGRTYTQHRSRNLWSRLEPVWKEENKPILKKALLTEGPYAHNRLRELLLAEFSYLNASNLSWDEIKNQFQQCCQMYIDVIQTLETKDSSFKPWVCFTSIHTPHPELDQFKECLLTTRLTEDTYSLWERRQVMLEAPILSIILEYQKEGTNILIQKNENNTLYFIKAKDPIQKKLGCEEIWFDDGTNLVNGKNIIAFLMETEEKPLDEIIDLLIQLGDMEVPLRDKAQTFNPPKVEKIKPYMKLKEVVTTSNRSDRV